VPRSSRYGKTRPVRPPSDPTERAGPAGYGMGVAWSGGPLYADRYGAKRGPSPWQLIEGHKQIAFACGEFNALGLAQLPFRFYSVSGAGRPKPRSLSRPAVVRSKWQLEHLRTLPYVTRAFGDTIEDIHEITSHELLDTLKDPARDPETGLKYFDLPTLIATLCRYLDSVGIAYLKPEDENGIPYRDLVRAKIVPSRLWPLQSQYVWPVRKVESALIDKFKYFLQDYPPGDLCFIRMRPSLRDPYGAGYAALQASWQYVGLEDSTISMWDQLMGGGARPNLILSPADVNSPWGEDEARRFEAELNTFHARGRAGRSLALRFPVKIDPITYPGWDLGELKVNEYQMERIANCYGCPVSYLTRETNLANFQAGRTFHAIFGIEPRAQCLASAVTEILQRYDERLFAAFDNAVPEDEELRAKLEDMGLKNGRYTTNEVNNDTPFKPKEWGDAPWQPQTLMQPDMAREKHEQGLKSAQAADEAKTNGKPDRKPGEGGGRARGDRGGPDPAADRGRLGHDLLEEERLLMARAQEFMTFVERELSR
jgi:hypothetical protein